jgi:hypothetical protein
MVCDLDLDYRIETEELPEDITWEDGTEPETPQEISTRGTLSMYSDGVTRAWLRQSEDPPRRELLLPDRMYVTQGDELKVINLTDGSHGSGHIDAPEDLLRRLLELTDEPEAELDEQLIDGRRAVGFEVGAAKLGLGPGSADVGRSVVRIWVDVETQLPVRVEYDLVQAGGPVKITMQGMWDHIRWNVPLDPAAFEPPEVTETAEVQNLLFPPATEDALIEGLRVYAEQSATIAEALTAMETKAAEDPDKQPMVERMRKWLESDSPYPKHLDPQSLMLGLAVRQGALQARAIAEYRKAHGPDSTLPDEQKAELRKEQERIAGVIGAAGVFYRKLIMEGREPEYFGATVEPGDASAVLVRWNLDDGLVRVIYGDLSAETLPADD